jgi:DNA polymerase-3 subunit delta
MQDIPAGKIAPVYCLYGEEPFFIDQIVRLLEAHGLGGADPSFNFDKLYGSEVRANKLVGLLRSYPVFAERRLVIIKEAHKIPKNELGALADYLEKPVPSTVLVLAWGSRTFPDRRQKLGKLLEKNAIVLESKPLYDNQVPGWIESQCRSWKLDIAADAAALLGSAMGTNLGIIASELDKIRQEAAARSLSKVDKNLVYELVSIDRDYNTFELMNALGDRNPTLSLRIIQSLMRNPKDNPPVLMIAQLYNFYIQLAQLQEANARSEADAMKLLGTNMFVAKRLLGAAKRYPARDTQLALLALHQADLALKGIRGGQSDERQVMEQLVLSCLQPALTVALAG